MSIHIVDLSIFVLYLIFMLGVGFYFLRSNKTEDDYFMVSGLLVPVLGTLICKKPSPQAALAAMILGGGTTLTLILSGIELPLGLDANFFGITLSALVFLFIQNFKKS